MASSGSALMHFASVLSSVITRDEIVMNCNASEAHLLCLRNMQKYCQLQTTAINDKSSLVVAINWKQW